MNFLAVYFHTIYRSCFLGSLTFWGTSNWPSFRKCNPAIFSMSLFGARESTKGAGTLVWWRQHSKFFLLVFQFAISVVFNVSTLVVFMAIGVQIQSKDPGFSQKIRFLIVDECIYIGVNKATAFKEEVNNLASGKCYASESRLFTNTICPK